MNPATDNETLLRLAALIADGDRIDWPADLDPLLAANLRWLADHAAPAHAQQPTEPDGEPLNWGHLQVLERLGEGGFGVVYRAFDTVLQREVALKLRRPGALDAGQRAAIDEARRLARVRHPHVLAVHGADLHDGRIGIWTDLLHGRTLEARLREDGVLNWRGLLTHAEDLAGALGAVHAAGLVHGDIKAANVMLDAGGGVVLMDFGAGGERSAPDVDALGSPLSMAPERFTSAPLDAAGDIYALGALWFRLLSGRHPIDANNLVDLRRRHADGATPDWDRLPRALPRALRDLLACMLSVDPLQRPDSDAVCGTLARLRNAPRRRRRTLTWIAVMGALVIALVAVSFGWLHARQSERRIQIALGDAEAVSGFLVEILSSPRPTESGARTLMTEVLDQAQTGLIVRFGARSELLATLSLVLAESQASLGRHTQALALLESVLALPEHEPGTSRRLRTAIEAARSEVELGRFDQATDRLAAVRSALGTELADREQIELLFTLVNGLLAYRRGEFNDAALLYENAWLLAQAIADPNDASYRNARQQLAITRLVQGHLDDAQVLLDQAFADSLARFGERHADSLDLHRALTYLHVERGDLTLAEQHARRGYEVARDWLGEDDPYTVIALSGLGNVLSKQGDLAQALATSMQVALLAERVFGAEHAHTLIALGNQATQLDALGRLDEADATYALAIERATRTLGASHSITLLARGNRAELWSKRGRLDETDAELAEVVAGFERSAGPRSGDRMHFLGMRADLLRMRGRAQQAVNLLRPEVEALMSGDETAKAEPGALGLLVSLARAEADAGRADEARACWQRVLALAAPDSAQAQIARDALATQPDR